MIELRTFGRIDLRGDDGQDLSSVLVHPKRVALLAYLSVARPAGFHRRDTLLALLWPELDQERARAALRKAVHHLRRSLGDGVLIGRGDEELALDATRFTCDAARFQDAVQRGDAKQALESYQGAFLDAFFVAEGAGFEDWLERERQHLHSLAFGAAWSLAEQAEANSDAFGAAHWARRAAELVPDDEGALRNLMAMLDRIGDRAGALAAYDAFARRLRREYDADPAAETRTVAQEIRERDEYRAVEAVPAAVPAMPRGTARPAGRQSRRRVTAIAVLVFAILAGASAVRLLPSRSTPVSARVLAVLPFSYRGDSELAYLGEGMVNLLSTNLDQLGDFRSVDAAGVLSRNRDAQKLDGGAAGNIALELGAGMFVLGDIVEADGELRVSAGLYEARRPDRAIARANAEGSVAQLFNIIDAVTAQLVAGERRAPAERFTRLALLTTHSVPALKAYLTGEQQFRAGRYNEAVESFQKAVQADTTFALGYYRLALAHMWGSQDGDRVAAERAIMHGSRLAGPDRALLDALLPFFRGDAEEAERQYRAILVTRPDESEVWYPLGEVLFHHNPMRGRRAAEAKAAFERALALGPKDGPLTHLVEIAAIERDYVAFDSLLTGIQPASHFFYVGQMVQAFRSGDTAARTRMLAAMRDSSDARLITAARHALFLLEEREHAEAMLALVTEAERPRSVRSWGYVHFAHLAVSAGQPDAAVASIDSATSFDAARALEHHAWLLSLPFLRTPRPQVVALRDRLQTWKPASPQTTPEQDLAFRADREIHAHVRLYLLGLLNAQLGDHTAAAAAADALTALNGTPSARDLAADLAHAVRAEVLRVNGRNADALAELERARMQFDANRLNVTPFYAQARERYVRAELLSSLGRNHDALGWFGSFDEHGPWGRALLAPAALQQARIYETLGRPADAARQYARFVTLWQDAEPRFQPAVAQAKQRLASLQRGN